MPSPRALRLAGAIVLATGSAFAQPSRATDVTAECLDASEKAQQLRSDRKLVEARTELAHCVREACPRLVRRDCLQLMDEVKASLASVVLAVRDASGIDVPDVRVALDGKPAERLDGKAILLDPGPHKLRVEPGGSVAVEQDLVVREGEKNRLVTIELPARSPQAADVPPRADQARRGTSARERAAVAVGLASLLAIGVGATFGALAIHERAKSDRECPNDVCTALGVSYNDQAITSAWFADFGIGLGVIGAAVAVYLYVTGATPTPTTSQTSPGGLGVHGSF